MDHTSDGYAGATAQPLANAADLTVASTPAPAQDERPRPKPARIEGLDGVRGLGCLAVIVGHVTIVYSPHTHDSAMLGLLGIALILFFALSGFLLFLPYVRRLTAEPSKLRMPDSREFALHRVMRVFPAYLVIFLICNFVFRVAYIANPATVPKGTDAGTGMITDPGQLLANLSLLQTYFPNYIQTGINPAWSLTLELAFYASLPLLALLVFALRKRVSVHPLLLACIPPAILFVVGVVGRLYAPEVMHMVDSTRTEILNWGPNWSAVYLRSFLSSADMFAYGMAAAVMFVAVDQGAVSEKIQRRARTYAFTLMVPFLMVALLMSASQSVFSSSAIAAFSALLIYVIIGPLALHQDSRLARWIDFKPFYYLGLISLSAYLWHYPLLVLLGRYGWAGGDTWGGMTWNTFVIVTATLVLPPFRTF